MALCGCSRSSAPRCAARARRVARRAIGCARLVALSPLLLGSVVLSRFDFWPAALAVLALAALLSSGSLGRACCSVLAIAAKLWPAVLAAARRRWSGARRGRAPRAAWTACSSLSPRRSSSRSPRSAPGGLWHSFHQQLARPLQIESLGAACSALHHVFGTACTSCRRFGSQNLVGTGAHAVRRRRARRVAARSRSGARIARGAPTDERLVAHAAAAVAALVAFGKVFSPQFMSGSCPFVRACAAASPRSLLVVALVLTQAVVPAPLLGARAALRAARVAGSVLARDLVLVALLARHCVAVAYASLRLPGLRVSSSVSARNGARTSPNRHAAHADTCFSAACRGKRSIACAQRSQLVAALAHRARDLLGKGAAEGRSGADRAAVEPAADERLGADEDVEADDRGSARTLPRRVGHLHPGEVRRTPRAAASSTSRGTA